MSTRGHLDFGLRYTARTRQVRRSFEDTALKQRALDLVLSAYCRLAFSPPHGKCARRKAFFLLRVSAKPVRGDHRLTLRLWGSSRPKWDHQELD